MHSRYCDRAKYRTRLRGLEDKPFPMFLPTKHWDLGLRTLILAQLDTNISYTLAIRKDALIKSTRTRKTPGLRFAFSLGFCFGPYLILHIFNVRHRRKVFRNESSERISALPLTEGNFEKTN